MTAGAAARPATARPALLMSIAYLCGNAVGWSVSASAAWLLVSAAFAFVAAALEVSLGRRARAWIDARRGRGIQLGRGAALNPSPYSGVLALAGVALVAWAAAARARSVDQRAAEIAAIFERYELARIEGALVEAPAPNATGWTLTLRDARLASGAHDGPPTSFPTRVMAHIPDEARSGPDPRQPSSEARSAPQKINATSAAEQLRNLHAGMRVAVWGRVDSPTAPTLPGEIDRAALMRSRGAGLTARARSVGAIDVLVESPRWLESVWRVIDGARWRIDSALGEVLDEDAAPTARALFLGDRTGIGETREALYADAGVAHLLSVSGAHIGFMLALILPLGRLLRLRPWGLVVFAGAALLAYASLTGLRPPVIRAAVMAEFLLVGLALRRTTSIFSALAASAFASAALDPRNPLRIDWQLSYICIGSIILFQPILYDLIPAPARLEEGASRGRRWLRWILVRARVALWAPLTATLATQMGLLPLQSAIFHEISLIGFFIQAPALALSGLIVAGSAVAGLAGAAAPWAAPAIAWLAAPLNEISAAFNALIEWAGGHPWATARLREMPGWLTGVYFLALLLGPHLMRGRARGFTASPYQKAHTVARVALFVLALLWLPAWRPISPGAPLELYVLDVGQGDCLVLRLPDGRTALIDGGAPRSGPPEREPAVAFLRELNITRLDFVLATHADVDHIGGLPDVMRSFDVGVFMSGPDRADSRLFEELESIVRERRIVRKSVTRGDRIQAGPGCVIEALNPASGQDNNDASVVWLVRCGEIDLLLTGDIEAPTEREILRAGLASDIEILKVAHHGSATSTIEESLDAFRPEVALISAGRDNRFGHPRPVVLERLKARGVVTARTDQLGTLLIQCDGRRARILRFTP